jgi:hypothetical protein
MRDPEVVGLAREVIESGLSLAHGSLICGVIQHKQRLTGTHRLTLLHIDLNQETLQFRTDFHILHTLDGCWIRGLHVGTRRSHGHHGILIIAKLRTSTAPTARN